MKPDQEQIYWQPNQDAAAQPTPLPEIPSQPVAPVPTDTPPAPLPVVQPAAQPAPEPAPLSQPEQEVFDEDSDGVIAADEPITWQASEYVHHDKQAIWYVALIGVTIALLALAIFMKAWTFAALIVALGVGIGVLAGRPPHTARYTLSESGLRVNEKNFAYHDFRSFGVIQEDAFASVVLIPTKRFMPAVNIYFPTEMGEQIVDILGSFLPMEQIELDLVEKIARKLHF